MAIQFGEFEQGSPVYNGAFNMRRKYWLVGAESDEDAKSYAQANVPFSSEGLPRVGSPTVTRVSGGVYEVESQFSATKVGGEPLPQEDEPGRRSFVVGGGSVRITHSLETVLAITGDVADPAIDFQRGINVSEDRVEGVEIAVPSLEWDEQHIFPAEFVNEAWLKKAYTLCPSVNSEEFGGGDPGEILFLGVNGDKRADGKWDLTFRFAASPNKTNFAVGNLTEISKDGHDYMWFYYRDEIDVSARSIFRVPYQVNIERVYPRYDLNQLFLPGGLT